MSNSPVIYIPHSSTKFNIAFSMPQHWFITTSSQGAVDEVEPFWCKQFSYPTSVLWGYRGRGVANLFGVRSTCPVSTPPKLLLETYVGASPRKQQDNHKCLCIQYTSMYRVCNICEYIYIYTNYLYTWTPGRTKDPCIFSSTAKLLHSFGKECISMVPIENVGSSRGRYILQISLKLHVAKQHIPEVLQRPEFHEHFH